MDTVTSDTSSSYRGRGRGRGRGGFNVSGRRKQWYLEWKDLENYVHQGGYDPRLPIIDRMRMAASHFAATRFWPREFDPNASLNIRQQWDQFQIFIGTLMAMPIWERKVEGEDKEAGDDAELSDDEMNIYRRDDFQGENLKKPLRPRPPYSNYARPPTVVYSDEEIQDLLQLADAEKNAKCVEFCDNPTKAITVFLSSYLIDQGLIYSDRFLVTIPRLVRFFIIYLMNNDVLDGRRDELSACLKVAETAITELILTSKLSKALPDTLNSTLYEAFRPLPVTEEHEYICELKENAVEFIQIDVDPESEEDHLWSVPQAADFTLGGEKFLMNLLGPTTLPLTHTAGAVETSTRRIKAVIPPIAESASDLESRFAQVVLSPWDDTQQEDIVILVLMETMEMMKIGMGFEGTWTQIVHRLDGVGKFWYVEEVMQTLTSYHTLPEEKDVYPEL